MKTLLIFLSMLIAGCTTVTHTITDSEGIVEETVIRSVFRKGAITKQDSRGGKLVMITDQTIDADLVRATGEAARAITEDRQ